MLGESASVVEKARRGATAGWSRVVQLFLKAIILLEVLLKNILVASGTSSRVATGCASSRSKGAVKQEHRKPKTAHFHRVSRRWSLVVGRWGVSGNLPRRRSKNFSLFISHFLGACMYVIGFRGRRASGKYFRLGRFTGKKKCKIR